jgi:hypothetical protein
MQYSVCWAFKMQEPAMSAAVVCRLVESCDES